MHVRRQTIAVPVIAAVASLMTAALLFGGAEQDSSEMRRIGGLTFIDQFQVTVIDLAVSVADKAGNPIMDLSKEDFSLLVDG